MRYGNPSTPITKDAIDIIYNRIFANYISPSKYEKMESKDYRFEEAPKGHGNAKLIIGEFFIKGHFVTAGYMATSIRDSHNFYIIWKT
jgi:hypothetical protein